MAGGRGPSSTGTSSFPLLRRELKVRVVIAATKGPSQILAGASLTLLSWTVAWLSLFSFWLHPHTVPYQGCLDDPRGGHQQPRTSSWEHQTLPSRKTRAGSGCTHGEPLGFSCPSLPTPQSQAGSSSKAPRRQAGGRSALSWGLLPTHLASWHPALTKLPGGTQAYWAPWPLRIKPWQLSVCRRLTGSPTVSPLWMERPRHCLSLSEAQM